MNVILDVVVANGIPFPCLGRNLELELSVLDHFFFFFFFFCILCIISSRGITESFALSNDCPLVWGKGL